MGIKPLLYLLSVLTLAGGSVTISPVIGLMGYLLSYNVNPLSFWWGYEVPDFFLRYSMIFSLAIVLGMVIHYSRLRFMRWFETQEFLLITLVGIMWLSTLIGIPTENLGFNGLKMTKVAVILLLASHLVTDVKYFRWMVWVYILGIFISGYEITFSETAKFYDGRLDVGIGGSDFNEGNFLAAHFLMVMPWVGITILRGSWISRIFCVITSVLVVNTLILIESRGAFLAIGVGVIMTVLYSGPKYRKKILVLLVIGVIGFLGLADPSFWRRMQSIETKQEVMDQSAGGRVEAWKVAIKMFEDHPFGIGEGNFTTLVGAYNPDITGKDTHNTFFKCLAELGIQGLAILLLMVQTAFRTLSWIQKQLDLSRLADQEFNLHILALRIAMVMYLVTTMFLTHTYVEEFYWLLMFPLFLKRCFENQRYQRSM